jgi:hypothetical protein
MVKAFVGRSAGNLEAAAILRVSLVVRVAAAAIPIKYTTLVFTRVPRTASSPQGRALAASHPNRGPARRPPRRPGRALRSR